MVARAVLTSWDEHPWFALELDGKVIGMALLSLERRDIANLGYDVARPHWGKGLAPEAARAVVDWGFREMGLEQGGGVLRTPRNRQSWRVMEKLGMTREGCDAPRTEDGKASPTACSAKTGGATPARCRRRPRSRPSRRPRRYPSCGRRDSCCAVSGRATSDDVFDYARDPEWAEYLLTAVPQPYTRRNADEFVARMMRASPEREPTWAMALGGTVVGAVGLSVDARHDTGELHYGSGPVVLGPRPDAGSRGRRHRLGIQTAIPGEKISARRRPPKPAVVACDGEAGDDARGDSAEPGQRHPARLPENRRRLLRAAARGMGVGGRRPARSWRRRRRPCLEPTTCGGRSPRS